MGESDGVFQGRGSSWMGEEDANGLDAPPPHQECESADCMQAQYRWRRCNPADSDLVGLDGDWWSCRSKSKILAEHAVHSMAPCSGVLQMEWSPAGCSLTSTGIPVGSVQSETPPKTGNRKAVFCAQQLATEARQDVDFDTEGRSIAAHQPALPPWCGHNYHRGLGECACFCLNLCIPPAPRAFMQR